MLEPALGLGWASRPASRACACVWSRLGLRGVPGPVRALWPAGVRHGVCEGWERRHCGCGCRRSQLVVGRSGWCSRLSCLRVCMFSLAGFAAFPRFRSPQGSVQSFRASPRVGWRGSEAGRAGLWGECKGGAGARLQTHNRGDSHGRSQAGGRFRHLAACRGRRQALWEIVRSILPEGPGKALRALPAAFWCRLPWPLC